MAWQHQWAACGIWDTAHQTCQPADNIKFPAVTPALSLGLLFTKSRSKISQTSTCPTDAALCSGVLPIPFLGFFSAWFSGEEEKWINPTVGCAIASKWQGRMPILVVGGDHDSAQVGRDIRLAVFPQNLRPEQDHWIQSWVEPILKPICWVAEVGWDSSCSGSSSVLRHHY